MKINHIISAIHKTVLNHRLSEDGAYARFLWQNKSGDREMGLNAYGCADAVNILYTINSFIGDPIARENHIRVLQGLQDAKTGLYTEATHHPLHTTAHCIAALELFDAKPKYPLHALTAYFSPEGIRAFLDTLDWEHMPWSQAHQGAGIYAAATLTDSVTEDWEKAYFDWLWENTDEKTGFWMKKGTGDSAPLFHHMGGSFHYYFNCEYAKKPVRYPERLIDTLLDLFENQKIGCAPGQGSNDCDKFGQYIGFLEMDWLYSLNRTMRQTAGYRRADCLAALRKFSKTLVDFLTALDYQTHDTFNDLHMLFGTTCALAELQTALPGEIETKKPLRLVLDRRPFI